MPNASDIRKAIICALSSETSNFGEAPEIGRLYTPPAHLKALRMDSHVVIGARGVGKSVWTAALGSDSLRAALGQSITEFENAVVHIGFSVKENINDYPNSDVFAKFLSENKNTYDLWRCVIARWVSKEILNQPIPSSTWSASYDWLSDNPEGLAHLMQKANTKLLEGNQVALIVFDALDRTSHEWVAMDKIVRDLLRMVLWLKSYPKLNAKVFLREDQFNRTITNFPDASKLLATKTELTWANHDLHGLLWQTLINAPGIHGECLRNVYQTASGFSAVESSGSWQLKDDIKRESKLQRSLFEALAGPWMGKDRRRGVPYVWSISHLADGHGRTSPRSFLAAIRHAAEDSADQYPQHNLALHYESIKRGVQKASEIRVNEMAEDYPWVPSFLRPLKGLTVPCDFDLIKNHWNVQFPSGPSDQESEGLPPQHSERGWDGLRDDLVELGLFELKSDGRINMPDLYRVGFGLGRRGGVKPKK